MKLKHHFLKTLWPKRQTGLCYRWGLPSCCVDFSAALLRLVLRRGKWGEFSLVKYKMFHPFSCLMHSMYLSGRMEVEHVRRFVPDVIWLHVIHCLTGGHVLPLSLSLTGKRFLSLAADRRVNQVLALKYVCTSQIVFFYCFFFSRESPVVHPTHF